jgi:hypothetical protein
MGFFFFHKAEFEIKITIFKLHSAPKRLDNKLLLSKPYFYEGISTFSNASCHYFATVIVLCFPKQSDGNPRRWYRPNLFLPGWQPV